jgi:hypothetical protein
MALRGIVRLVTIAVLGSVLGSCAVVLRGQTAASPTAYVVTANNWMKGPLAVTKTYRLGSKALVEQNSTPAEVAGVSHTVQTRTIYDLDKKESYSWDPLNNSATCVIGSFDKDWGDPYAGAGDLIKRGAKQIGTEMVGGFQTRVLELVEPARRTKAWVDTQTGMVVKLELTSEGSTARTLLEVTNVSLESPPESMFALPVICGGSGETLAAAAAPVSTDEMDAMTGGNAKDFVAATVGPASKNACTMLFRVVRAGTLAPFDGAFQLAVDLKSATETDVHYNIGTDDKGRATFAGGALHEVTAGAHGLYRVENVPERFVMDVEFGDSGAASANIYRQCSAPQTVLLYVVKNAENIAAGGDWLWAKSGKLAVAR